MSKSLNLSKVLLASLAPIIAHQTTYAAQQVEPIQLDGAQIPNAAQVNIQVNNYAGNDVAALGFTALIGAQANNLAAPLTSKVTASIAGWKADMGNNNLQVQWKQNVIQAIAAQPNNQNLKLQAVKQTFHAATLVSIQNDQNNGLVTDQASLRANPNRAAAIYDTMKALAKALYDFREDQNEWGTLASLQHVFYLLEANNVININGQQIQVANIQQNNNAQFQALQQRISEDIDEFISSLHEWNPAAKVSFNDRANARQALNLNNVQDTNNSVKKFLDYKKQICGDFDEYITLDQFYQFNSTAAHMADLDGLDPKAFVNPNIMNELVFADGALYIQHPGQVRVTANNEIDTMLREMSLIDGTSTALKTQDIYRVVQTINQNFTLKKYNTAKANAINDSKAAVLNVNDTIAQNFANDLDKLKTSIAKKLASETESSVKMATDFLDKDNGNNNNQTIFDDITAMQIQNYDNIHNLDELTDAIVQLFHNANPNNSIQNLKANDLKAIKITDTTFYKSTQPNNQNEVQDIVAQAKIEGIDTFLNILLGIDLQDKNKLYTTADVANISEYITALTENHPDKITNEIATILEDYYVSGEEFIALLQKMPQKVIYQLLNKHLLQGENNIDGLTLTQALGRLSTIPEDQLKSDIAQILHIDQKSAADIVADQNLINEMMNNHTQQFEDKIKANYIKRDVQTILNDPQLRQRLVSTDTLDNLQQQLNTINTQKQNLTNTINNLNNQVTQLKEQIKQKENDLNRQIRDKDTRLQQINEHLVNNNNNIPTTSRDHVINNMQRALLDLPKVNGAQIRNFTKWIIEYEAKHGKIEDQSESDLRVNCIRVLKNYAGKNNLKDVLLLLKRENNIK